MTVEEVIATFPLEVRQSWAAHEGWMRGDLSHLLRPGAQTEAYEQFHAWQKAHPDDPGPAVLHMHRGAGKSWLIYLLGIERAVRLPAQQVRIGSPTITQTEEIMEPAQAFFTGLCPKEIRVWSRKGTLYFHNPRWPKGSMPSSLSLFGCRENAKGQRGLRSTWIALDEVRDVENPEFVVESVLGFQFVQRENPFILLSSTAPAMPDHPWWRWEEEAQRDGRLVFIPVTANPYFSERDEKALLKICKTKESAAWQREALLQKVPDKNLLAIPSYAGSRERIRVEYQRPHEFFCFVFGDMGFIDCAAFLFCYIDFEEQRLVIEDEIVRSSLGTRQLVQSIREKEYELWTWMERGLRHEVPHFREIRRWADATPRELDDLRDSGLHFSPARVGDEKWDKWQGLARLESAVADDLIRINPRCKSLDYQLANATKNERRDDLERVRAPENPDPDSPVMGHQDAIWALAYGLWQIRGRWLHSPKIPKEPGVGVYQGSKQEEMRREREPPVIVRSTPLKVTEYTGHIRGADTSKVIRIGGRRVRF